MKGCVVMKQLVLGKIKTKDLADWFGISYGSFRVVKQQKLDELKLYCDFEEVYGGVNITKIYDMNNIEYIKDSKKNYEIIRSSFDEEWSADGIDTCSNVAFKIYDKHKNELTIADTTAYNYTLKARNELFGIPFLDAGELGSCIYLWCKKEVAPDGTLIYTQFTDEEDQIRKDLMKKHFSTDVEKEIFIAQMVEAGEITKAQAYDALCKMKNLNKAGYGGFLKALKAAIGCEVSKTTLLFRNSDNIEFVDNKTHMISSESIKSKQNV